MRLSSDTFLGSNSLSSRLTADSVFSFIPSAMLYLDDFVESVETLPQDMKHYMNDLRDIDLRVKGKQ